MSDGNNNICLSSDHVSKTGSWPIFRLDCDNRRITKEPRGGLKIFSCRNLRTKILLSVNNLCFDKLLAALLPEINLSIWLCCSSLDRFGVV
jgi:hypothetical protein